MLLMSFSKTCSSTMGFQIALFPAVIAVQRGVLEELDGECGVQLKMSLSRYPEMDGEYKTTNRMVRN